MDVVAISTPRRPGWYWRIVNYAGESIEESHEAFPTIATAIVEGARRLKEMNVLDVSQRPSNDPRPRSSFRFR